MNSTEGASLRVAKLHSRVLSCQSSRARRPPMLCSLAPRPCSLGVQCSAFANAQAASTSCRLLKLLPPQAASKSTAYNQQTSSPQRCGLRGRNPNERIATQCRPCQGTMHGLAQGLKSWQGSASPLGWQPSRRPAQAGQQVVPSRTGHLSPPAGLGHAALPLSCCMECCPLHVRERPGLP